MNGVAIVICVNITMSCLYQIVPYMCSMYPLSVDNKKKKKIPTMSELLHESESSFERGPQDLKDTFRHLLLCRTS